MEKLENKFPTSDKRYEKALVTLIDLTHKQIVQILFLPVFQFLIKLSNITKETYLHTQTTVNCVKQFRNSSNPALSNPFTTRHLWRIVLFSYISKVLCFELVVY